MWVAGAARAKGKGRDLLIKTANLGFIVGIVWGGMIKLGTIGSEPLS